MEFKDVVKDRYSCKKYSDRQVPEENLLAILEAGICEAEEKVASFGTDEWKMFFNGDSLAFHNKYGTKSKSELEQLRQKILESVETTKTTSVKKTF